MEDWSLDIINAYCQEHFAGEFVCEMADGKGRILIAKKAVPQGELLFSEAPLHIACEDEDNEAFLTVRRICEENDDEDDYDPIWYWCALSSLTAAQIGTGPKHGTLEPISEAQQKRLLCLYHEPVTEASAEVERIVAALGLTTSPVLVEELLQAWILNCFEHSEDPLGHSAYFASSFVSHSCGANAVWTEGENGAHILRARQDIAVGDEVTISYLEEHVLLHSAEKRKKILQETKLFECSCERCAPPRSAPSTVLGRDTCRGFYCKKCKECGIFHRLDHCKKFDGLRGVACTVCGNLVDQKEGKRLLQAEANLEAKLKKLDEQCEEVTISDVMDEDRAQSLLKLVAQGASGPVGPQHWLCDRLWGHLEDWYKARNQRVEQRRMLELRVRYQRVAYSGLSAALAWTLERQGDMLLRHLGFGAKKLASDAPHEEAIAAQILPIFEDSGRILRLMFGTDQEHYMSVAKKLDVAKAFLERRAKAQMEAAPTKVAKKPAAATEAE